jgi:putative ABC transport system ATP-binding protein
LPSEPVAARCEDLVKTYRTPTSEVRALKGITFEFPRAALTAVVGPSGSGKSSLLRAVAGIERATSGTVTVGGVAVHRASMRQLRQLRRGAVGYLFQRPSDNFLPHLTVGEHLRLAARGPARRGIDAAELLETLGIARRITHRPSELSGGEQQRAAIAQVLVAGANVVVADEPTAELDSDSARAMIESIHDLSAAGVSFVVATHDPAVMLRADATLELDHGVRRVRHPAPPEGGRLLAQDRGQDPTEGSAVVVVDRVSKTYRRGEEQVHALRDIDLRLPAGQLTGLVGRSGSGKTTLLNVIAGWEHPDAGEVIADGRWGVVPSWSEVAVVPQKLGLLDELTVRENIEYPARLTGRLDQVAAEVDAVLEELGLDELQDRYPKETSLGEQQRASIARAVVFAPRVLLADEPTGHQDRSFTRKVFGVLERAAGRGTTCLVATHNEEVAPYLDAVFHISDGRLSLGASPS